MNKQIVRTHLGRAGLRRFSARFQRHEVDDFEMQLVDDRWSSNGDLSGSRLYALIEWFGSLGGTKASKLS